MTRRALLRRRRPPDPSSLSAHDWIVKTNSGGFTPRDGAMAIFHASKYWLMGGWNPGQFSGGVDTTNQILSSTDATTWTQALAHNASPPTSGAGARWKRRHFGGCLKHTHDSVEYVYVLAGDHLTSTDPDFSGSPSNGYQSDIWRTTDPGGDWTRVATSGSVPFAGRMLIVFGSSPGALWAFGGMKGILNETPSARYNDLFRSLDGGATWTTILANGSASSTRPSGRGIINKMPYWNGRIWLVSGGTYDGPDYPTRDYFREVWSFDPNNPGLGFTKHSKPPFLGTEYNSVEVFDGRLFLFGGYSHGINTRTVWSTADGERWIRHATPPWPHSHADATCVNGSTLLHATGNGDIAAGTMHSHVLVVSSFVAPLLPTPRGIWKMSNAVLSGSNIVRVPDSSVGGSGLELRPNTTGDATYNATDDNFGNKPSAQGDGGHFLHTASPIDGTPANIDLSSCSIFIVAKPDATDGLFYFAYALLTSPTRYVYFASNRTGADDHETTLAMDVLRGGVNTTGSQAGLVDVEDVAHIYMLHYDGTAAGSGIWIDGAKTLVDTGSLTGNAGTGAFSAPLYILSDNGGTGSKGGRVAEIRVYPALTATEQEAVLRELRDAYPYKFPT